MSVLNPNQFQGWHEGAPQPFSGQHALFRPADKYEAESQVWTDAGHSKPVAHLATYMAHPELPQSWLKERT